MRRALTIAAAVMLIALAACSREQGAATNPTPAKSGSSPAGPTDWIVTWATSPQPPIPGSVETFSDSQPIRLIVRTSAGGERVRVRFSNAFGTTPLDIKVASIALRKQGAEIAAATERKLNFTGAPSAIVAPGKELVSDSVDFALPAFADVAITFSLGGDQPATTTHILAQQTSYVGAKDTGPDFKAVRTLDSWPFLGSVEVQARGTTIAVLGDSTVDGDGTTADANRRWPDYLARRLGSDGVPVGIANLGLIGNRLMAASPSDSEFGEALGRSGIDRLANDLERLPQVRCVILRIGINDIGFPGSFAPKEQPLTSGELIAAYRLAATIVRAKDARVIGTTLAPFEGTAFEGYYTEAKEKVREEMNAWIRSTPDLDGVIDADAVLRDPAHPTKLLAAHDSGDHLHPGDAGNERLAAATPADICTWTVAPG